MHIREKEESARGGVFTSLCALRRGGERKARRGSQSQEAIALSSQKKLEERRYVFLCCYFSMHIPAAAAPSSIADNFFLTADEICFWPKKALLAALEEEALLLLTLLLHRLYSGQCDVSSLFPYSLPWCTFHNRYAAYCYIMRIKLFTLSWLLDFGVLYFSKNKKKTRLKQHEKGKKR